MRAHVRRHVCARVASAQAGDKDGVRKWGRCGHSSIQSGARAEFSADLSICAALCCGGPMRCEGEGLFGCGGAYGEGRREKDVAIHRDYCHPVIQTAPQTQISGLGSCVSLKL